MIKLKASYDTEEERDKLIKLIEYGFAFKREPKIYKKEGPYKKIRMDLLNK
ncbi:hypothetical protein [Clostridium fermenticellae]|uniref:hypothetical protein n=1 Tax=Clostridium fermenticellae TaxID=2068654 RepID=UPI0013C3FF4F|nr:hypothetical protein [Clostridium fermenticellae]